MVAGTGASTFWEVSWTEALRRWGSGRVMIGREVEESGNPGTIFT